MRALWGPGCDVLHEGDLPREHERPDPNANCKRDVRYAGRDGLPAVKAEGDHAGQLVARGCDTNVDGVFDRGDGGRSRRLASGDRAA